MAKVRSLYVSDNLDATIEEIRCKLGMSRSKFYMYAATKLLQELSVLTEIVHREDLKEVQPNG